MLRTFFSMPAPLNSILPSNALMSFSLASGAALHEKARTGGPVEEGRLSTGAVGQPGAAGLLAGSMQQVSARPAAWQPAHRPALHSPAAPD